MKVWSGRRAPGGAREDTIVAASPRPSQDGAGASSCVAAAEPSPARCRRGTSTLERDVVVRGRRGAACAGRGGRGREVAGVDRDVRARGEPAATAVVVAAAEELDGVGDDVDGLALAALLALPLAPLQAPVDRDGPAAAEVAGAVLALGAPDGDVEEVGLVHPLAGRV